MSAATAPRHDDRHLETFLGECVRESLDNHMVSNAVFLCERLHAASPGEHTTHLLATCYHRAKQPHRARAVLRGQTSERCRYLLALCCYDLGRLPEAERALVGVSGGRENVPPARPSLAQSKTGAQDADAVPNGAAGFHLLGLVCKETGRRAAAVAHFATAMSLDPFMWSAREELCGLGAESEARDAEARFFGGEASGDKLAHAGYPTLRELGGYLETHPGGADETRLPSLGAFSSAALFGFDRRNGAGSTAPKAPFGTFRARPVVPDSAAPAAAADRAPPAETPGPARDLRLDEAGPGANEAAGAVGATGGERDPDASGDVPGAGGGAGPPNAHITRADLSHDLETPSPADPASAPPPVGKGRGGAAGSGFPQESEAPLAGEGSGAVSGAVAGSRGEPRIGTHGHGGRGARRVFVDEGKLRKVSGRLFADPATEEKFASGVRRSSRLASIAGASPGFFGAAETPAGSGFVTPAHPGGDEARDIEAAAAPAVRRGGRGARGAARGEYGRRESLDGEPSSRRSSEDGGAEFPEPLPLPTGGYPRGYPPARVPNPILLAPGRFAEGALAARALLAPLADAAAHLSMFRGAECVAALSRLDARQRDTGYALCLLGKAHAEMVEYQESARAFERARRVDPTRLESCEVYSTVLWHLKRDTRLSHLAQECVSTDRLAPQTWCALGNCFSLQKEHETALRFFRRALQLDPKHPYAHTLCGHEYFANEDFEKAMTSYRAAIRLDPRHYNAWYGLGTVYYRQEKYELSEYHFRHALGINSRSSVLFCYLGMAQHALRRTGDALELLRKAVALDAKNPLAKYEKASVLLSEDRFQEALEALEELKTVAPREASVFFLMGRIYKKLGLADQAMVNFSVALDLKPASSDVNLIKNAIEKLHVPDDSEDEDL